MQILCERNISLTSQCKTQTTDYCFHHANEYGTTIVPLFSNLESYPSTLTKTSIKKSKLIGHLHDVVILLTMTLILQGLLSCANQGFCYLSLTGIMNKYEKKAQKNSGRSSKMTPSCKCFQNPLAYLDLTKRTLASRKTFAKLRIRSHKLRIEKGRYDNIPRDERLCSL